MNIDQIIAGLRADNDQRIMAMRGRIEAAEARDADARDLTTDERAAQDADDAQITRNNDRITELLAQQAREAAHAESVRGLNLGGTQTEVRESTPYHKDSARGNGPSFFRDLWRAGKGDGKAVERLTQNNRHRADQAKGTPLERAITTVNGAGGEFVPPLWLEQNFIQLARPGRAGANLCEMDALPEGTDSINIPRLLTGTAVAGQTTQNTAIQQTDITTDSVNSSVFTVAGGQTLSLQLFEQSPLNIDKMVLGDLARAYGIQIDNYALAGTGTNQPRGILNVSGINTITYTSASPTAALLYSKLAGAIAAIQTSRFDVPTYWLMHPNRWYYLMAQVDTQGRPLVVPDAQGPYNNLGDVDGNVVQGRVGSLLGIPVVLDPNVPTNLGAGTNQDVIILAKWDDLYLWEGQVRAQAFEQTYANQLSLFLRLYNYMSFQGARYPKSIAVISGTGLVAPTF